MRWAGHVARRRGIDGVWWGYLGETGHLEDLNLDGRILLRWIFRKWDGDERDGVDWTDLAEDRDSWKEFVNAAMNFRVSQNVGNFLTS
jgi:hypothetical protein